MCVPPLGEEASLSRVHLALALQVGVATAATLHSFTEVHASHAPNGLMLSGTWRTNRRAPGPRDAPRRGGFAECCNDPTYVWGGGDEGDDAPLPPAVGHASRSQSRATIPAEVNYGVESPRSHRRMVALRRIDGLQRIASRRRTARARRLLSCPYPTLKGRGRRT
jgi:hypothetical protein